MGVSWGRLLIIALLSETMATVQADIVSTAGFT